MSNDHDWLNLVEVSGPFLAVPVLKDVFPQGLEALSSGHPQRLRRTYEEWREAVEVQDVDLTELHAAWVKEVLSTALEIDDAVLRSDDTLPASLTMMMPEHGTTITPDLAVVNPTNADEPLLLIHVYAPDTNLEATHRFGGLAITPADRMVSLLRATGCPIGLVTNGERWMLVHAPVGAVAGFASWYARLWGQEPETLRAFVSLLGVRRFFGPEDGRLTALYERSLKHQDDVTEALGEQVRRAVEVLVQSLDRANQDRNQELLRDVDPRELYEASLTVMMRLVFLLAAEERGLLLLGDPRYDSFYAISSLRMQLRSDSEEILERRRSAWSRLLGLFRGVFGGIEHPTLRLPALGGSLFDPDRYPFLEGRKKGTFWRTDPAEPLPIDDRTVLLLLEAIQTFQGRALSYRALNVEQIGHVYEGLLERTVKRVDDVTLELDGGSKAKSPRITLGVMESARLDGTTRVVELIKERSERSESAIRNALERQVDDRLAARLLTVCRGDGALRDRILPLANLLRTDPWGYPLVHHKGAFVVVLGADRRESGTHYTPKSMTEKIVDETLTPVAYRGPAEGKPPEEWELKSAEELLELKICDPAMGSGAFLVQACRWLSDRLVEAWSATEETGKQIDSEGHIVEGDTAANFDPLSQDVEERAIVARRLVAERCLYGVDKNPLAVELAKLSLWLTTMSKGRPFGFLDHNLRSGDSLLGIHDIRQLTELSMSPKGSKQLRLFGRSIVAAVEKAIELRTRLRSIPIRDIGDVDAMATLDNESRQVLQIPLLLSNAVAGIFLTEAVETQRTARLQAIEGLADAAIDGKREVVDRLRRGSLADLASDSPEFVPIQPFHWPVEFPEAFQGENKGFDAVIGNPPFGEGDLIGENFRRAVDASLDSEHRNTPSRDKKSSKLNFVSMFVLLSQKIARNGAHLGLVCPKTILRNERYWKVRSSICKNSRIMGIVNFPTDAFRSASVETCSIFLRNGFAPDEGDEYFVFDLSSANSGKKFVKTSFVISDPTHVIRLEASSSALALIEKLDAHCSSLSDFYETRDGINPGRKDFRPILLAKKVDDEIVPLCVDNSSSYSGQPFTQVEPYDPAIHKRTLNGRDFEAFSSINWNGTFVRYMQEIAYLEEYFVKGTRWSAQLRQRENYDRPEKVISRQTASTLIATLDVDRYFPLNTVHSHFPKRENSPYSCRFLAGILNSRLLRFYYQKKSEEVGKVFPQVHISALRTLPVPVHLSAELSSEVSQVVDQLLQDPLNEKAIEDLNQKIYNLYGLSSTERVLVDEEFSGAAEVNKVSIPTISKQPSSGKERRSDNETSATSIIAELLLKDGSWLSKSEILEISGLEAGKWNAAINDLLARGTVKRTGERRGARYKISGSD